LGSDLSLFASAGGVPYSMNLLHGSYFMLEVLKVLASGVLLNRCWKEA
jgi:hypothetical protein